MRMVFIRHGKTKGNTERRYIGRTDEPLCRQGILEIQKLSVSNLDPDVLFVSPMKRCRESAKLLFPEAKPIVVDDFREYDFGVFEGKNYEELKNDPNYARWIKSDGKLSFPAGEGMEAFQKRCQGAFEETLKYLKNHLSDREGDEKTAAYVVHGGTIMSVFSKYEEKNQDYYSYQCKNADGYVVKWEGTFPCRLTAAERIGRL